jgi:hypothetical protein
LAEFSPSEFRGYKGYKRAVLKARARMKDIDSLVEIAYLTVLPVAVCAGYAMVARWNASGFSNLGQLELPIADWLIVIGMIVGILILFRLLAWPIYYEAEQLRKASRKDKKDFPFIA